MSLITSRVITLMVGRTLDQLYPARHPPAAPPTPMLTIADLRPSANEAAVSFEVRRGEILGLSGLEGQGQREIIRSIAGIEPVDAGRVDKFDAGSNAMRRLDLTIDSWADLDDVLEVMFNADVWNYRTDQGTIQESFHPNFYGQKALGYCLRAYLNHPGASPKALECNNYTWTG